MIIGLCGPTDLYDLRRAKIASGFARRVFYFDDLTCLYMRNLPITYRGKTYEDLVRANDRVGICALKQQVEDGIRAINPRIYTDWMTNRVAVEAFPQGLKTSTKVTECVIGDVKYPDQAVWMRKFGTDKHNRLNKLVLITSDGLPSPLSEHISEQAYLEFGYDQIFDHTEPDLVKAVDQIRKNLYVERP